MKNLDGKMRQAEPLQSMGIKMQYMLSLLFKGFAEAALAVADILYIYPMGSFSVRKYGLE
jgi:hypothetical protein